MGLGKFFKQTSMSAVSEYGSASNKMQRHADVAVVRLPGYVSGRFNRQAYNVKQQYTCPYLIP